MKKSIVAFALAAAFTGSVAAQSYTDNCRIAVGWWTVTTSGATGATLSTMNNSGGFAQKAGTKMVASCSVPKNKGISITLDGPMSVDECSVYNDLGASDSKLAASKLPDAKSKLGFLYTKINTLAGDGKLTALAAAEISGAVLTAYNCVDALIGSP